MAPESKRKEIGLPATGLLRGDEGQGLEPWAPSVFSGESEEAGQSWVGGLLLGTGRGCPDPWRGFGQSTFHVSFCHSWDMDLEGALALGMCGPSDLFCRV